MLSRTTDCCGPEWTRYIDMLPFRTKLSVNFVASAKCYTLVSSNYDSSNSELFLSAFNFLFSENTHNCETNIVEILAEVEIMEYLVLRCGSGRSIAYEEIQLSKLYLLFV